MTNKVQINTLANACPYVEGTAVFKARVINALYQPNAQYNDRVKCIPQGLNKNSTSINPNIDIDSLNDAMAIAQLGLPKTIVLDKDSMINTFVSKDDIAIYPNPTNGQITINYNCATDGNFYLYNATGQLVSELFLSHQNQRVTTTLQDVANGIYTYKIVFASCPNAQGKLTIVK
jgi:Secretion system C-terminal sorting domain